MTSHSNDYNLQSPVIVDPPAVISSRCQGMVRLGPVSSEARVSADFPLISAQVTESPWSPAATMEPPSNYREEVLQEVVLHLQLKVPHHVSIRDSFNAQQRMQR